MVVGLIVMIVRRSHSTNVDVDVIVVRWRSIVWLFCLCFVLYHDVLNRSTFHCFLVSDIMSI